MLPYQKVVGNRKKFICDDQLISVTTLLVGLQNTKKQNIMETDLAIRMYTIMALTCSVLHCGRLVKSAPYIQYLISTCFQTKTCILQFYFKFKIFSECRGLNYRTLNLPTYNRI